MGETFQGQGPTSSGGEGEGRKRAWDGLMQRREGGKAIQDCISARSDCGLLSLSCKFYGGGGERRQANSAVYFCDLVVKRFSQDSESAHVYQNRAQCLF